VALGGRGRQVYLRPDLQGRDNGDGSKVSCGHAITRLDRSKREDSYEIKESSRGGLNRWPSSSKVCSTENANSQKQGILGRELESRLREW
jgi:hypothetical protein